MTKRSKNQDDFVPASSERDIANAARVPHLQRHKTLVLNGDFRPQYIEPFMSLVVWTTVMTWMAKSRGREQEGHPPIYMVLEEYEDVVVRSGKEEFKLPLVVALTENHPIPRTVSFSPANLYLRDNFTCQYTGVKYPKSQLNMDHVQPSSKGGKTDWLNCVTSNIEVNTKKGDKTLAESGLRLIRQPFVPTIWDLARNAREAQVGRLHQAWEKYVTPLKDAKSA